MSNPQESQTDNAGTPDKQQVKREKPKEKFEPIDYYLKNTYIDCKDSVNNWCLGKILERSNDNRTIKVNFEGWSHKWDEVKPFHLFVFSNFNSG